jgi:ectoine hydroxylase-related dioxygenase (phytanoyl-CoA dioxygenase family)
LDKHKAEFEAWGITKYSGLVSPAAAHAARDLIREEASKHSLLSPTGWQRSHSRFGEPKPFRAALNRLNRADHFPDFVSKELIETAQALLGDVVRPLPPGQQILFTLPGNALWSVPNDVWHVDVPRFGTLDSPGLQMFTFIDSVGPKAGATLVLAGSHRLLNNSHVIRSKELKRLLRRDQYFQWLFDQKRDSISKLDETRGTVDNVVLQVHELTGQVGDVYFMDLRTLHTPAPNCSDTARLMLTCRLPRAGMFSRCLASGMS